MPSRHAPRLAPLCETLLAIAVLGGAASAQTPAATRIPDSVREHQTIANDSETAARLDNEPLDPALKGFFQLPGTSTRLRIDGSARADVIHDFSPIGSTDDFVIATIPVDDVSGDDNTRLHARQSRITLELRRPGRRGDTRAVFENDFFGSAGERAFNLRHAYVQGQNVLGGFTVSTLADPDARPDTLDHEGPPARVSARHAQVRYTLALPARQTLALAIEDPRSDVAAGFDGETFTARTPLPDVLVRYRLDARRGHLQIGSVYRSVGGSFDGSTDNAQVFGAGVVVSASVLIGRHHLVAESTIGRGVARYVKDTSGLGLDAAFDANGRLEAIPLSGALVGFQHRWSESLRTTAAASIVRIDNTAAQTGDTYHLGRYLSANLLYKSRYGLTFGAEVDYGQLTVVSGDRGTATRLQFAIQYELVR